MNTETTKAGVPVEAQSTGGREHDPGTGLSLGRVIERSWVLLILIALIGVFTIATGGRFITGSNVQNIVLNTSVALILAGGVTFVLIAAQIDLSIGSLVIFSSVVGAKTMIALTDLGSGVSTLVAILVGVASAMLAGAVWGLINGWLTMYARIPSFIVTLGTFGVALGMAQVLTDGVNVTGIPPQLQADFANGALGGLVPYPVLVAAVVMAVLWFVLVKTRFGLRVYAIGANAESARRAGVNVHRTVVGVFVLMGLLAGVASIIDMSRFGGAILGGQTQTNLTAIAAVVIGGTSLFGGRGGIGGTIVGALIPSVLLNGLVLMGVQSFWQGVAVGTVLIGAVYIDQLKRRAAP